MAARSPKVELKKTSVPLEDLYKEGQVIPAALYDHMQELFNAPAYSKKFNRKRVVAHKIDHGLKKYLLNKKMDIASNYLLFHKVKLKKADIKKVYNTVQKLLKKTTHVIYRFTPTQFKDLKANFDIYTHTVGDKLTIYWHGNQTLTGAPLVLGGAQHIEYFQWGNLYGIVKYLKIPGEEIHHGNLLIYFESRRERNFKKCLDDLLSRLQQDQQLQLKKVPLKNDVQPLKEEIPLPAMTNATAPRFDSRILPPGDSDDGQTN